MNIRPILFFLFILLFSVGTSAQLNQRYLNYIDKYKGLAIEQMERYRIPASITLAQGLFESGAGESTLARKSNNHFGIKCGSTWTGPYVCHDDDAPGERFRVYRNVRESYEDHSLFLKKNRYAALFQLKMTDYKGWARGLKRAGYATDPSYAQRLIRIIEQYQLYRYDQGRRKPGKSPTVAQAAVHEVAFCNGLMYVKARGGDTLAGLAKEFRVKERKLRKYNDLYKGYVLKEGDIIYLEAKKKKASKANGKQPHIVRVGDSMYYISQLYGIRLKNLYRLNRMHSEDSMPPVGSSLRIR